MTLMVLVFVHADLYWQREEASGSALAGPVIAVGAAGLLAVVTLVTLASAANFFIVVTAVGVCLIDLAGRLHYEPESLFVADTVAAAVVLMMLGVVCDRIRDRLFLLIARIAVAVIYLRVEIFPTVSDITDLKPLYMVGFGVVAVLAILGARARVPVPAWSPYGPNPYQSHYTPGPSGYNRPPDQWRG
jgi:hypothetical protein